MELFQTIRMYVIGVVTGLLYQVCCNGSVAKRQTKNWKKICTKKWVFVCPSCFVLGIVLLAQHLTPQ